MKLKGTITTQCSCDDHIDIHEPYNCDGECYNWSVEDFAECVAPLFKDTNEFKISGIRLWDRTIGGVAECETAEDLVRAMSVQGEFTLNWEFDEETNSLGARLSHHDNPMGSWVTVEAMTDEEVDA